MYPDEAEFASQLEEAQRDTAIKAIREAANKPKTFTGYCRCCNDVVKPNSNFCSPECREDFEFQQKIKHIRGK